MHVPYERKLPTIEKEERKNYYSSRGLLKEEIIYFRDEVEAYTYMLENGGSMKCEMQFHGEYTGAIQYVKYEKEIKWIYYNKIINLIKNIRLKLTQKKIKNKVNPWGVIPSFSAIAFWEIFSSYIIES